jgi:iron complex outermembrane recepter protein
LVVKCIMAIGIDFRIYCKKAIIAASIIEKKIVLPVLLVGLIISHSCTQESISSDSIGIYYTVDSIEFRANRIPSGIFRSPYSVSVLGKEYINRGQTFLTPKESLDFIPGVFSTNDENFAQDLRVSIRGFGSRAAFGMRGIKLIVDGIPETTPDGITQIDNLEMAAIESIEVIRGAAASFYGNASGGVIEMSTSSVPESAMTEVQYNFGSFGYRKLNFSTGNTHNKLGWLINASHTRLDGFRENSGVENLILNGRLEYSFDERKQLKLLINHAGNPRAGDPGALTIEEALTSAESANPRNILFAAGEFLSQSRVALVYESGQKNKEFLRMRSYVFNRNFENSLPFEFGGIVNIKRWFGGTGLQYTKLLEDGPLPVFLSFGMDLDFQSDQRQRFNNLNGDKGPQSFNQRENFMNAGVYANQIWFYGQKTEVSTALRYDYIRISGLNDNPDFLLVDEFIPLSQLNPSIGISHRIRPEWNLFVNYSSSFETPSLIELSNNPFANSGFNPELRSQFANSFEVGAKWAGSGKISGDIALYHIRTTDEILPFELAEFPQRIFYRNAGSTSRTGLETSVRIHITKALTLNTNMSYARFLFRDYELNGDQLDGNRLPALPQFTGFADLRYVTTYGLFLIANMRHTGQMYANDTNTVDVAPVTLLNFRMGYTHDGTKYRIEPLIGINNVMNSFYFSNIRANAAAGRFYETASPRHYFGGVKIRLAGN